MTTLLPDAAGGPVPPPLPLSDDERRVLELHGRLQQLQLEIALITAQNSYVPRPDTTRGTAAGEQDPVEAAREGLLDSRARYVLRNDAAESVMVANPIMQAVHGGTNASPIERDLLPILRNRDASSTALAQQTSAHRALLDELAETEAQAARVERENAGLAAELLALTQRRPNADGNADGNDDPHAGADPALRSRVRDLEAGVRDARRRWRVVKAAAAAVVAGSGVDWARDPALRDVVLDGGDEDGDGDGGGDGV